MSINNNGKCARLRELFRRALRYRAQYLCTQILRVSLYNTYFDNTWHIERDLLMFIQQDIRQLW